MTEPPESRLIVLTGPSCVGKSPLRKALYRHHPDLSERFRLLTLYTTRTPRPGERDGAQYFFRGRDEIQGLESQGGFLVMDVRGDLQAVDQEALKKIVQRGDSAFYEGNPFIAKALIELAVERNIPCSSVFLTPLSKSEIKRYLFSHSLDDLERTLTEHMLNKLRIRASTYSAGGHPPRDEDHQRRAASAFSEIGIAPYFDAVIPNHDGEGSDHWEQFDFPIGDAGSALDAFVQFLAGREVELLERWDRDLFNDLNAKDAIR